MNRALNDLVKTFLQKNSWQDCDEQELRQFNNKHPYFAATHVWLLKKLSVDHKTPDQTALQKAYLYFYNPLQLEQHMVEKGEAVIEKKNPEEKKEEALISEPIAIPQKEWTAVNDYNEFPTSHQPLKKQVEEKLPTIKADPPDADFKNANSYDNTDEVIAETESNENNEPLKPLPSLKIEPIDPSKADFNFQPFHTVDYFASQGIKMSSDDKPKDKFGQQLKSFTEWLKTIKKVPASEIKVDTSLGAEKKVEQLAEHSLSDREVITEAMAAVWEKQGNKEKAIRIYDKLSLLNPSKRAYFAAKIDHLKNS